VIKLNECEGMETHELSSNHFTLQVIMLFFQSKTHFFRMGLLLFLHGYTISTGAEVFTVWVRVIVTVLNTIDERTQPINLSIIVV